MFAALWFNHQPPSLDPTHLFNPPLPTPQAQALFEAPRVVVSHQTQADPVLCYGNRRALVLWEMDAPTLTSTPSRLTAEPLERAERQRLLDAGG